MTTSIHKNVIQRKSLHIFVGISAVLLYCFFEKFAIYANISVILAGLMILIFFREKRIWRVILKYFGGKKETGLSTMFYAISILICFALFKKNNAAASIIVLAVSDSFAAVFGKRYDKKKELFTIGSLSFFITSLAILIFFTNIAKALLISMCATIIQSVLEETDNIIVPISIASFLEFLVI